MCVPQHEVQYTRPVGEAENAAQHGDAQGYADAGGLEGDDQRNALKGTGTGGLEAWKPGFGNPLASLGLFALRNRLGIGVGKFKNPDLTSQQTQYGGGLAIPTKAAAPTGPISISQSQGTAAARQYSMPTAPLMIKPKLPSKR